MYSIEDIKRLQLDEDYYQEETDKFCLVSLIGKEITSKDIENHANFCILEIIDALKKNYLTGKKANELINKIDAFEYSTDLLGPEKVIFKMNKEIIEEELHIPHFNSLCIICDDLYDIY